MCSNRLKVCGEDECKMRQNGVSKLPHNYHNKEILASVLTGNNMSDGEVLDVFLDQTPGSL